MTEVLCRRCGDVMERKETISAGDDGPTVEMYECPRQECGRKAGVIYEPEGGLTGDQQSWVEREVGMRGSFFPTDWTQTSRGPRFGG